MMDKTPISGLVLFTLVAWGSLLAVSGCHSSSAADSKGAASAADAKNGAGKADEGEKPDPKAKDEADDKKGDAEEGLHLKPEEVKKLGVVTEEVRGAKHAPEAAGYGMVIAHETIAQSLADLRTAKAVARQSQSARDRGQRLVGTAGAMPVDAQETAERQATVDQAALELVRQRLTSTYGQQAPWKGNDESPLLASLASGETKLVRVTFPINAVMDAMPSVIRLGRIGMGQTAKTWDSSHVWSAPADTTVPGRSFFAIVKDHVFGEGERLVAWTPVGEEAEGVLIPASAVLISTGKYWCYIAESEDVFAKTEFDPSVPVSGGYFVTTGVEAGDKIVTKAAGQLLAKELNPSTEAE